jgi:hypothetical protein
MTIDTITLTDTIHTIINTDITIIDILEEEVAVEEAEVILPEVEEGEVKDITIIIITALMLYSQVT